jgi:hypothetical protein
MAGFRSDGVSKHMAALALVVLLVAGCSGPAPEPGNNAAPSSSAPTTASQPSGLAATLTPNIALTTMYEGFGFGVSGDVTNNGASTVTQTACLKLNGKDTDCHSFTLAPGQSTKIPNKSPLFNVRGTIEPGQYKVELLDQTLTFSSRPLPRMGDTIQLTYADLEYVSHQPSPNSNSVEISLRVKLHNGTQDVAIANLVQPGQYQDGAEITGTNNWNFQEGPDVMGRSVQLQVMLAEPCPGKCPVAELAAWLYEGEIPE